LISLEKFGADNFKVVKVSLEHLKIVREVKETHIHEVEKVLLVLRAVRSSIELLKVINFLLVRF
jgi:hypothetical protein